MEDSFWNEHTITQGVILLIKEYVANPEEWSKEEFEALVELYMEQSEKIREEKGVEIANQCLVSMKQAGNHSKYYYVMSFLLGISKSADVYQEMICHTINDNSITKENKFFLYYQYVFWGFVNSERVVQAAREYMDQLYRQIYKCYCEELQIVPEVIGKERRTEDLVFVFTAQVLGLGHGPTKTLLDRCYILAKTLKKRVYIINTAEEGTIYGRIEYCFARIGNYFEEYNEQSYLEWKGEKFGFYQCPREMPEVSMIKKIIEFVKEEKPCFILNLEGHSIVSDICSNIIPTLTLSLAPSDRTRTLGQFQIIGRKITEEDRQWLVKNQLPKDYLIECLFTSSFRPQTINLSREQLNLPEKAFVVILVGLRLGLEIDDKCINLLERLMKQGIHIAFMGQFEGYEKYVLRDVGLWENSTNLHMQEDVLAVLECCDLYLNPKRIGGGTSVAEALYKKVPVVTMPYGDGGVGAGEDFWVEDYEEMYQKILQYASDKEYHKSMREKAHKRAERMMNSEEEFVKAIRQMEQSEYF